MRRLASLALAVALVACAGPGRAPLFDGPEELYALAVLPRFDLTLDDAGRAALRAHPRAWTHGRLRYGALDFGEVGVRLKGHRSLRALGHKPSFKLKVDQYVRSQRFFGLKKLVLNNLAEDPTMVREILAYRLFRQVGVPAPDAGYAQLYVDGAYQGLYLFLEAIDDRFIKKRFGKQPGAKLYEGEYGCDLYPTDVAGLHQDEGDADRGELAALAEIASNRPVGELFFGDHAPLDHSVLAYLAVSALIGDFDGYRHAHNYRVLYVPSRGRWFFIPWGLDRSFKQDLPIYDSAGLVAARCFADAACRHAYLETMKQVVDEFDRLHFEAGVDVVGDFIAEAARADRAKGYDDHRRRKELRTLREHMVARVAKVRAQLACLGDGTGPEVDADGDGYGCMDCDDRDPAIHPGAAEVCDGRDDDCSGLVDDAPACGCPIVAVGVARFAACDLPMRYAEAEGFCVGLGGHLARVADAAEAQALGAAARHAAIDDRWWIGLDDRAREGTFVWRDGAALGYADWGRGEPDDGSCGQDCAAIMPRAGGTWQDAHCGQKQPFFCRLADGPSQDPAQPVQEPAP